MVFDRLYTLWKRERKEIELIPLQDNFFDRVKEYLRHLETLSQTDPDPLIQQLFKSRFERVNFLVNDLINIRAEKQFIAILSGNTLSDERSNDELETFNAISNLLSKHKKKVLGILDETIETTETIVVSEANDKPYWLIYFTANDADPFLGTDLLTYGPFVRDEIAYIPAENARQLVLQNKAKVIEI